MNLPNLDGDPMRYPLLSAPYRHARYGPVSVALVRILAGGDGSFGRGSIEDHMNRLLNLNVPFTGPDAYEVGRWSRQFSVLDDEAYETLKSEALAMTVPKSGSFYAWLDSQTWDYRPALVIYDEDEFRALFLDACLNLCKVHRHLEGEYLDALRKHGLIAGRSNG